MARSPTMPKPVSPALQGGGAHGAFIWGVLEPLSESAFNAPLPGELPAICGGEMLRSLRRGRTFAGHWLDECSEHVGSRSSLDIHEA